MPRSWRHARQRGPPLGRPWGEDLGRVPGERRQAEEEGATLIELALHPHPAAVPLHDLPADVQAHAETAMSGDHGVLTAVKGFENALLFPLSDAGAAIGD